jgi:hypothetical protein
VAHRFFIVLSVLGLAASIPLYAQSLDSFALKAYPDVWYNTEDGLRLGARVSYFRPLEYEDDHKVDLALGYATGGPENPLSYFARYQFILWPFYRLDEPAFLSLSSLSRVGVNRHGVGFSKYFTESFSSDNSQFLGIDLFYENRFESAYLAQPEVWQMEEKWLGSLSFSITRQGNDRSIMLQSSILRNFATVSGAFSRFDLQAIYSKNLDALEFRARLSGSLIEGDVAPEHGLLPASRSFQYRLASPFFRAEGLMPQELVSDGIIQYSGGLNLRGYQEHEAVLINSSAVNKFVFGRSAGLNMEIQFPNPITNRLRESNITGAVLDFRSYFFADAGHISNALDIGDRNLPDNPLVDFPDFIMDAGIGLALDLNFPDFLGNRRGFILRYELPFWLSYPLGNDENLAFRQIIGFGGILRF